MRISRHGLAFTAGWESFIPYPYDDKAGLVHGKPPEWKGEALRGTATIGFGHTDKAAHPLKVRPGIRVTKEEAYEILDVDMDQVEAAVNAAVRVRITQSQFDALCDLGLNMGIGNLRKSALIARLNAGNYDGARAAFDLYVNSGGVRMKGLVRRRDAEQLLWDEGGEAAAAACPDCDEYVETPKGGEVARSKSLVQSRTIKGALTTAAASGPPIAGAAIKAANDGPPAPAITERITEMVDRAGNVIDTVKTVHENIPVPDGFWLKAAHLATDPFVMTCLGLVLLSGLGFIGYERWRKLKYEGV